MKNIHNYLKIKLFFLYDSIYCNKVDFFSFCVRMCGMLSKSESKVSLKYLETQNGFGMGDDLIKIAENYYGKNNIRHVGFARLYDDNSFSFCCGERILPQIQFVEFGESIVLSNLPIKMRTNQFKLIELNTYSELGAEKFEYFNVLENYLGMKKSIFLAKRSTNYIDMYQISLKNIPDSFNYYLSNLDKFEQFFYYLYSNGHTFLSKVCETKMQPMVNKNYLEPYGNSELTPNKHPSKFMMMLDGNSIMLSKMEYKVLKSLSQGLTSKSIGLNLNISYKTVHSHLDNIKEKTSLHYKDDLILFFRNNSIIYF